MTVQKGKNIEFASMTWEKYMPIPQPSSACIYANGRWALVVTEKFLRLALSSLSPCKPALAFQSGFSKVQMAILARTTLESLLHISHQWVT